MRAAAETHQIPATPHLHQRGHNSALPDECPPRRWCSTLTAALVAERPPGRRHTRSWNATNAIVGSAKAGAIAVTTEG